MHRVSDERWLFEQAVELWGEPFQIDLLIEECAELIEAIRLHGLDSAEVVDEVADVLIMCAQSRLMVGEAMVDAAVPDTDKDLIAAAATMIRLMAYRHRGRAGNDVLAKGLATLEARLHFVAQGLGVERVAAVGKIKMARLSERVRQEVLTRAAGGTRTKHEPASELSDSARIQRLEVEIQTLKRDLNNQIKERCGPDQREPVRNDHNRT